MADAAVANEIQAQIEIRGVRPLLWNCFGADALPLTKQERTGVAGNDPEEWRRRVSITAEQQLYLDPSYIFATIREGARNVKKGRGSIMSLVAATLQVFDDVILLDRFLPDPLTTDKTAPVYLDVRGVVNPSTKGRNVRYRVAAAKDWLASFTIFWDPTVVSRSEMHAAVIDAGRLSGLGDGRKIGMGRFSVERFEVIEAA